MLALRLKKLLVFCAQNRPLGVGGYKSKGSLSYSSSLGNASP